MVQDILGFHSGDYEHVIFWDVRLCVVWQIQTNISEEPICQT